MLKSVLIANRGEIACRVVRTARRLGIESVAVFSDVDRGALHVRLADRAVYIGPSPARESYLVTERLIDAAKSSGAEAVHPGYGFLSENADFAQAVHDAGLIWIGPDPDSIRAMGLKDAAKARMIAANVPVTPGYLGADQDATHLEAEAKAVGYPVLIKAVAGGGGKGMRRVDTPDLFQEALVSCRREAASSFGDDRVMIEKYILSPRHIEVQVFGDRHGEIVHLFERDCSLQRRHQKVIEEAPAPGMSPEVREHVCAAAVRAARSVDYVGAGTIEFIADASEGLRQDRIWFMEMNTRLQVEHPVTEEISGVDLVEWQIRIASGEPLPKRQEELSINGWAMEARLYAEDPRNNFLPSIGKLEAFELDGSCRIETGVERSSEVSPYYDPMIAKVIAWGASRETARAKLHDGLKSTSIWPLRSNAGFLIKALEHPDFIAGNVDTGLIAREGEALWPPATPSAPTLTKAARQICDRQGPSCFRLNAEPQRHIVLALSGERIEVDLGSVSMSRPPQQQASFVLVQENGQTWRLEPWRASGTSSSAVASGVLCSPMPGRILSLDVAAEAKVVEGQKLLSVEAMKMEHAITAPFDGHVVEINVEVGDQVVEGATVIVIEPSAQGLCGP